MQANRPPGIDVPGLDFVALAQAFGCRGKRVVQLEHLDRILGDALPANGPALIDVVVDDATTVPFNHGPRN